MTIYNFIQQQRLTTTILLYICIMGLMIYSKPSFLFNIDDSIKQFGIGYQSKTVLPLSIMKFSASLNIEFLFLLL